MKTIIDNLMYDTDKSEKIFSYVNRIASDECYFLPGYCFVERCDIDIYKTKSGRYFEHNKKRNTISTTNETSVQEIIKKLDPDKYEEIYGKVQDA